MTALNSQWYETPDLAGDWVKLVQLHEHHAPGVLAAADNDAVFAWLSISRPNDLEQAQAIVDKYISDPNSIAWAQIDQRSNELAGLTTYYDINPDNRTVTIGSTWLSRKHWRSGINTESKLLLLTRAFDALGAVRVVWHTDIRNEQSQSAIERLGARKEGVLRKHRLRRDGTWRDTVIYSMLDEEWPEAKQKLAARLS